MKLFFLRIALVIFGLTFVFGLYPLMQLWPSGWRWNPPQNEYEQMILGIYATLGVFLVWAAKNPMQSASLIWFVLLGFGARWLAPWFARLRSWQVLDGLIGVTMIVLSGLLLRHALAAG